MDHKADSNTHGSSIAASSDATDSRYNKSRECHAGQIQVSMSGSTAQCMTYDPTGDNAGIGDMPQAEPS